MKTTVVAILIACFCLTGMVAKEIELKKQKKELEESKNRVLDLERKLAKPLYFPTLVEIIEADRESQISPVKIYEELNLLKDYLGIEYVQESTKTIPAHFRERIDNENTL